LLQATFLNEQGNFRSMETTNRCPLSGQSVDKAFANVVTDARLGNDVTPHVLRHTAATWLMQAGTDVWEAAGYLGMTIEMLSQRYGHHHPDHLSGAKGAFTRHRKIREAVA
jgi:integrase